MSSHDRALRPRKQMSKTPSTPPTGPVSAAKSRTKRQPSSKAVEHVAEIADAENTKKKSAKRSHKQSPAAGATHEAETLTDETKFVETPNVLIRLMADIKLLDFQWDQNKNKPIYTCKPSDKIVDVFKGLAKQNILSVPVMTQDEKKYQTFLGLDDIVEYVVEHFGEQPFHSDRSFLELCDEEKKFGEKTVRDFMCHPCAKKPFYPIKSQFSLLSAVEILAKESRRVRSLAVCDANHTLFNLVTQSQLVEFLHENMDLLGKKADKKISAIGGVFVGTQPGDIKQLFVVKESDKALRAFRMMNEHTIQGVPIVDDTGRLKGALSVRDLKNVSPDMRMFWRLQQTVKNFIRHLRHDWAKRTQRPARLVYAKYNDSFGTVIKKLHFHKLHRLFIVDNERRPIGVISLRDVLREVLTEKENAVKNLVADYREKRAATAEEVEGDKSSAGHDIEGEEIKDEIDESEKIAAKPAEKAAEKVEKPQVPAVEPSVSSLVDVPFVPASVARAFIDPIITGFDPLSIVEETIHLLTHHHHVPTAPLPPLSDIPIEGGKPAAEGAAKMDTGK